MFSRFAYLRLKVVKIENRAKIKPNGIIVKGESANIEEERYNDVDISRTIKLFGTNSGSSQGIGGNTRDEKFVEMKER